MGETIHKLIMKVKNNFFVTVVFINISGGLASKIDESTLETIIEPKGPSYDNECADAPARLSQLSSMIMSRDWVRVQRIFRLCNTNPEKGYKCWSWSVGEEFFLKMQPHQKRVLQVIQTAATCRYGFNGCHIQPRNLTFWIDEKTGELEATMALLSQHHHFKSSGLYEESERWDCAVPVRNSSDGSLELTYSRFSGEGTIIGPFTFNMTNEDILRIDQNSSSNRPKVVDTTIWICWVPILAFFFRSI